MLALSVQKSKRNEINFGMNLCAFQLFARGTYRSPLSASGMGNLLSSTFSFYTCCTFTAGGCLPPLPSCNYTPGSDIFYRDTLYFFKKKKELVCALQA